jgi:hypothetical protein
MTGKDYFLNGRNGDRMAKKKEAQEEPLEKQLWKSADKLRKNIDAAGCPHSSDRALLSHSSFILEPNINFV